MADRKLVRLAAGALILATTRTDKAMRQAARAPIAEASAELQRQRSDRRAALLLLLLASGKRLAEALAAAIVAGREMARQAANRRLAAELDAAGASRAGSWRPLLVAAAVSRRQEDAVHARAAADSLATQWRGMATQAAASAERIGKDPYRALARTGDALRPRIARTATTETAQAYNDEHHEAVLEAVRYGDVDGATLAREWSATIDACERCWPHHGEQVPIDEDFSGGDEPGDMHPHCQCVELIVLADNAARRAA